MNIIQLFYILWMFILPILGVTTPILGLLLWVFYFPPVAKMLIKNKLRNITLHLVGDTGGYAELVPNKEALPEGIHLTKKGWHFLPRPSLNPDSESANVERIVGKTYMLKGFGKPIMVNFAGKLTSMNFGTLAALCQNEKRMRLEPYFEEVYEIIKDIPGHFKKPLEKKLEKLKMATESEPVTNIDVEVTKEVVNQKYPPSQIDALAQNRLEKGKRMRGKDYTTLGLIIIGIAAIVILGICGMMFLG